VTRGSTHSAARPRASASVGQGWREAGKEEQVLGGGVREPRNRQRCGQDVRLPASGRGKLLHSTWGGGRCVWHVTTSEAAARCRRLQACTWRAGGTRLPSAPPVAAAAAAAAGAAPAARAAAAAGRRRVVPCWRTARPWLRQLRPAPGPIGFTDGRAQTWPPLHLATAVIHCG